MIGTIVTPSYLEQEYSEREIEGLWGCMALEMAGRLASRPVGVRLTPSISYQISHVNGTSVRMQINIYLNTIDEAVLFRHILMVYGSGDADGKCKAAPHLASITPCTILTPALSSAPGPYHLLIQDSCDCQTRGAGVAIGPCCKAARQQRNELSLSCASASSREVSGALHSNPPYISWPTTSNTITHHPVLKIKHHGR